MKSIYALVAAVMLTSVALAQPAPGPGGGKEGPPPAGDRGPRGRDGGQGRDGGPGRDGGSGRDGPGGFGRGPGDGEMDGGGRGFGMSGSNDPRMMKFELMRSYFDAVDRYARLAHDPGLSGIAAVVAA